MASAPVAGRDRRAARARPALTEELFRDPRLRTYAILDGASTLDLLGKLRRLRPEHACLFAGQLDPSVEQTAPYVVELEHGSEMARWVLEEGWGEHWGIFVHTGADLPTLRKHLKTFLLVRDPDGKRVYFRYYDPRVMRVYLPTCNEGELAAVFGPVLSYSMEDETAEKLLVFERGREGLSERSVRVGG